MNQQYEIAVLYDPGLEIDLEKGSDKVTQIFKDNGGKVLNIDNWGKKKLAYPINKQDHAIYVFYNVQLPAENVQKIETAFNITDEIIRFLIVRPDLKAMAKAEEAKAQKAQKAQKAEETTKAEADSKEEKTENKTMPKENEKKPKESVQLKQTKKKSSSAKLSERSESNDKAKSEQTDKEV